MGKRIAAGRTKPAAQETTTVHFHGIAAGGDAVGRSETGKTVFAPFAGAGDVARVRILDSRKHFDRGEIIELQTSSPVRRDPPCPYYRPEDPAHSCGGCQVQHLNYAAQLEAKRKLVSDALERLGGFRHETAIEIAPCEPSPSEWHYRNKADLIGGFRRGRAEIGFYARESHRLIDIESCPIQSKPNNVALAAVRAILNSHPEWPFDPATGRGELRRVILRSTSAGRIFVHLATKGPRWLQANEFAAQLAKQLPNLAGVTQRQEGDFTREAHVLLGTPWLEEEIAGIPLRARSEAFLQVNPAVTPKLVELALKFAQITPGTPALDLYCGVGMFALALARAGAQVLGLESNPTAIAAAKDNAARLSLSADFIAADVAKHLATLTPGDWPLILLDPPRAGAAEAVPELLRLSPQRIVYVSCDPATLARDLRQLAAGGYHVERAVPVDMFPQTAHVETVVALRRA